MILFIGLFFAHRNGRGEEFMSKAGWWLTGAIGLGLSGILQRSSSAKEEL